MQHRHVQETSLNRSCVIDAQTTGCVGDGAALQATLLAGPVPSLRKCSWSGGAGAATELPGMQAAF